ncbi:hypothetical protein J0H58_37670, partial [bacterium]|nr:hypothetical protein [bacterium]
MRPYPPSRGRVTLALEELEAREVLSPVVTTPVFFPTPPQTPEGAVIALAGGPFSGGSSFAVFDVADVGQTYTADLIATRGTLGVDAGAAVEFGVAVANNDTTRVTLTGQLSRINSLLGSAGYKFTPDAYFSGDATVALAVTDPAGLADGSGAYPVQVLPVVQPPSVVLGLSPFALVGPGPVAVAPGTFPVVPWADTDGSEVVSAVLSLSGGDPAQFTLTAAGVPVPLDSDSLWVVSAANQPALQARLDALVLSPPAGFRGAFTLDLVLVADDTATFPSTGDAATARAVSSPVTAVFRYFGGGAQVTAGPISGAEGQSFDLLAGAITPTDPDDRPGDTHVVTLTAPVGVFDFDPSAGSFAASVTGAGTGTLTVTGTLADVAQVFGTPGALVYTPPTSFSGEVLLAGTLRHFRPGPMGSDGPQVPGGGEYPAPTGFVVPVRVAPVPSFPPVFPAFEGAPVVPIGPGPSPFPSGLFDLFPTPDQDGSETLSVAVEILGGPTQNFVIAAGGQPVPRQPDGSWLLTAATASGLQGLLDTLTIDPVGGVPGFGYVVRLTAVVTDTATFPTLGTTDTQVDTRTLPDVPLRVFVPGANVG